MKNNNYRQVEIALREAQQKVNELKAHMQQLKDENIEQQTWTITYREGGRSLGGGSRLPKSTRDHRKHYIFNKELNRNICEVYGDRKRAGKRSYIISQVPNMIKLMRKVCDRNRTLTANDRADIREMLMDIDSDGKRTCPVAGEYNVF